MAGHQRRQQRQRTGASLLRLAFFGLGVQGFSGLLWFSVQGLCGLV